MLDQSKDEETIFKAAARLKTPAEQIAYIKNACGDDSMLLARVASLLQVHSSKNNLLDFLIPDPDVTLDDSPISEGPGTVIGRYKLLEKIGEGGMAVVYMAEQEEPIRRKVALKIIKLGMDTKSVIARFEAERQALAMMDHPNIAKVLDAGATETGRPYFVMELVKGVSITEYCDANSLSTKERLTLFIQVCNAVQHAHQKGIIHRDIKPTNVMVTHHDGKPVPKVIDFGIAKAINQKLTEKTLFTRYAHIIGTPAYMSPEQAELSDLDIDTRTDIYSLGVLLYELLTGTTPFGEEELRKAGYIEMQRVIREQEPAKPSTKLSTLGKTLTDVAKHRSTTPDVLTKAVRGDLDWIVMKSLEKDRARRYEATDGLALDILRHLEHRPVLAHAPSAGYRLRKFLRRNRSPAIAVLAVVVVIGIVVTLSVRNRYQVQLAEAEGVRQVNALAEARKLIASGDLTAARKTLKPILESEHVGLEARTLFANTLVARQDPDDTLRGTEAIMDRHYRERVQYYTEQIAGNPNDPNNYLYRAQQYHYLCEETQVHADMRRYRATLNQGSPSDSQLDTPRAVRRVINGPFEYQLVFSAERPTNEIPVLNVAFGQKGRCSMKSFHIPMLPIHGMAISLLGFCLLSGLDSPPAYADFTFGEPVNLESTVPILDGNTDVIMCFSYDGLEMYIESLRPGGYGDWDLWVSKRASIDEDWQPLENLGPALNTSKVDAGASISADGLTLYFTSGRTGGYGYNDIYMATRVTRHDPWSQVVNMGPKINSSKADMCPWISADGLELYFVSYERAGGYGGGDIYVARRATTNDPWAEPVNIGPVVNSPYQEHALSLSSDGLLMVFADRELFRNTPRPGGCGGPDVWMTRRASLSDPWQPPVNLGPNVNGPEGEYVPRISPDGHTLYFSTDRPPYDNWQVPIIPICDFNSDGIVDIADVYIMLEHWHTDYLLCDIGPMPWGDGFVDAQDLIVLAEHIANNPGDANDVNNIQ
jgi:serine/threonine protein kinase